jgi:hypothetical protein
MKSITKCSIIILFSLACALADREPAPPTKKELLGSWVGFDVDYKLFYRLTLTSNSGLIIIRYVDDDISEIFRITQWGIKAKGVSFDVFPEGKVSEQMKFESSHITSFKMAFTVSGTSNDWTHRAILYREAVLTENLQKSARTEKGKSN